MKMLTDETSTSYTTDNLTQTVNVAQQVMGEPVGKKTLYEILDSALREVDVLPKLNEGPVKGNELLNRLRPYVSDTYSDFSIRNSISKMSRIDSSPIAKFANGQGYYCRMQIDDTDDSFNNNSQTSIDPSNQALTSKRDAQREEKFRAMYIIYLKSTNKFPAPIEHTKAQRDSKGTNVWKYPDVTNIKWSDGIINLIGDKYILDKNMLQMKSGSGDPLFDVDSSELKVEVNLSNYRKSFYQCVSNSSWANTTHLVVALEVSDQKLVNKLKKLASKHGVSIICFNMSESKFDELPSADVIRNLSEDNQENLLNNFCSGIYYIYQYQSVGRLDWDDINDLCSLSAEFSDIIKWISRCLMDKQAYSLKDFKIKELEEYEVSNMYAPLAYRH